MIKQTFKLGDKIILFVFLIVGIILFVIERFQSNGAFVKITNENNTQTLSLYENTTIELGSKKKKNTIVIENGTVYMKEANCPDLICVHHKPISKNGEMIICVPNDVYIEVVSDEKREIDN